MIVFLIIRTLHLIIVIPLYGTVITLSAHIKLILNMEIYYHRFKNTEAGEKVSTYLEGSYHLGLKSLGTQTVRWNKNNHM